MAVSGAQPVPASGTVNISRNLGHVNSCSGEGPMVLEGQAELPGGADVASLFALRQSA
jgi:hypothetical protein